jgi:hypothetical protein
MTEKQLFELVQDINDRLAIAALNNEFAYSLDHHDRDRFLDIFTENVEYSNGDRHYHDRKQLALFFDARHAGGRISRHLSSGLDIRFTSRDTAQGYGVWLTFTGSGTLPVQNADPFQVADVHDLYLRTADGWKIMRREIRAVFRNPGGKAPPSGET